MFQEFESGLIDRAARLDSVAVRRPGGGLGARRIAATDCAACNLPEHHADTLVVTILTRRSNPSLRSQHTPAIVAAMQIALWFVVIVGVTGSCVVPAILVGRNSDGLRASSRTPCSFVCCSSEIPHRHGLHAVGRRSRRFDRSQSHSQGPRFAAGRGVSLRPALPGLAGSLVLGLRSSHFCKARSHDSLTKRRCRWDGRADSVLVAASQRIEAAVVVHRQFRGIAPWRRARASRCAGATGPREASGSGWRGEFWSVPLCRIGFIST